MIALLLAVSLVAFITHLVGWVFLLVDNLIVGVEISASIGGVVFFLVLLLFWFSFLFLLILLGLGLWVYIFTVSIFAIVVLVFHLFFR